jgi:Glycosyltransferase family 18
VLSLHACRVMQVMILPGVLTSTNFAKPDVIHRGGPLGELTQWADLIAACFALCNSLAVRYHVSGAANEYALVFQYIFLPRG